MIAYHHDRRPGVQEISILYACAPLRRPIDDPDRIRKMYEGSNVVITAYASASLVGILRGWTDGVYDGYICDLAVHPHHQRCGIGRRLLDEALGRNPGIEWILIASPIAERYYAHIGWTPISQGWNRIRSGPVPSYDGYVATFQKLRADGGVTD
jgi:GNAT superfamily N-acetyltransferase